MREMTPGTLEARAAGCQCRLVLDDEGQPDYVDDEACPMHGSPRFDWELVR